ncbi:hypothetical protein BDZ97DRAFT_1969211, partial [Flammula alnicola]
RGSVNALAALGKIQRIATLAITGALRTTPNDLLDAHAGVLPIEQLLQKACHRAIVRIATLDSTNPAAELAHKYRRSPARTHITSIQHLIEIFNIDPTNFETIPPKTEPLTQEPLFHLTISKNIEESLELELNDNAAYKIYTDGAAQDGQVAAAAVRIGSDGSSKKLTYHLGTEEEYDSTDAEAVGCLLGIWLMRQP